MWPGRRYPYLLASLSKENASVLSAQTPPGKVRTTPIWLLMAKRTAPRAVSRARRASRWPSRASPSSSVSQAWPLSCRMYSSGSTATASTCARAVRRRLRRHASKPTVHPHASLPPASVAK
eukprot:4288011-Pleurochrysis_carterae.AAC.5